MAKSSEYAISICIISTITAAAGVFIGLRFSFPVITASALLPAVLYEVYRTEGISTIWASWGMLIILVAEGIFLIAGLRLNISKYFINIIPNLPVIDAKLAGPVIMMYFSYILLKRTAGIYTRWLAVVIFLGSAGLFLAIDPSLFTKLTGSSINDQIKNIPLR